MQSFSIQAIYSRLFHYFFLFSVYTIILSIKVQCQAQADFLSLAQEITQPAQALDEALSMDQSQVGWQVSWILPTSRPKSDA